MMVLHRKSVWTLETLAKEAPSGCRTSAGNSPGSQISSRLRALRNQGLGVFLLWAQGQELESVETSSFVSGISFASKGLGMTF